MIPKSTKQAWTLGGALVLTLGVSPFVAAADNAMAGREAERGYMLAEAGGMDMSGEGKSGGMGMMKGMEGCGENMRMMMDANKDGKVSKDEFMKHHEETFAKMDKDHDRVLDQSEMAQMGKMMESHCSGMPMQGTKGGGM